MKDADDSLSELTQKFPSSETSETLTEPSGQIGLFSPQEFRANLQVGPGSKEARRMTAGSGQKLSGLLAKRNPLGVFSKILLESETWASQEYLLNWKAKVTKCGCSVFQLAQLTPRNSGTGIGSWPTVRSHGDSNWAGAASEETVMNRLQMTGDHSNLEEKLVQVKGIWKSPSVQEPGITNERLVTKEGKPWVPGERAYDKETGRLAQTGLPQQVKATWPTVQDFTKGGLQYRWGKNGERRNELLTPGIVKATWQTPAKEQYEKRRQARQTERNELMLPGQVRYLIAHNDQTMPQVTWPTPCQQDVTTPRSKLRQSQIEKGKTGGYISEVIGFKDSGLTPSGSLALTESFVVRLTTLSAWLMGYTLEYISKWDKVAKKSPPQEKDSESPELKQEEQVDTSAK